MAELERMSASEKIANEARDPLRGSKVDSPVTTACVRQFADRRIRYIPETRDVQPLLLLLSCHIQEEKVEIDQAGASSLSID